MPPEKQPAAANPSAPINTVKEDAALPLQSRAEVSEASANQKEGGTGRVTSSAGAVGSSGVQASRWTELEEKDEGGIKEDMVKVSQWIRDEQEAMEKERVRQEGLHPPTIEVEGKIKGGHMGGQPEDEGDIFGGSSKEKRGRDEDRDDKASKRQR